MKYGKILTVALALAMFWGCGGKDSETAVTTPDSDTVSSSPIYTAPPDVEDPRDIYTADDGQVLGTTSSVSGESSGSTGESSDKGSHTVKYTGFKVHAFTTPVKGEGAPSAAVVPVYSKAGLLSYIEDNSALYDFGYGEHSFTDHVNKSDDSFFYYNGVVVISLRDGADGFFGAWDDGNALTLAIRETAEKTDATHVLVEMDSRFMALWNSFMLYTE